MTPTEAHQVLKEFNVPMPLRVYRVFAKPDHPILEQARLAETEHQKKGMATFGIITPPGLDSILGHGSANSLTDAIDENDADKVGQDFAHFVTENNPVPLFPIPLVNTYPGIICLTDGGNLRIPTMCCMTAAVEVTAAFFPISDSAFTKIFLAACAASNPDGH